MTVAVVVVNFNGRDDTLRCLESLSRLCDPVTTWLVDNGSAEPVEADVRARFPAVRFHRNDRNLGFTGGHNTGARLALADGARYVLHLNNDTEVDPGFVAPLLDAMERDPRLGMATPKILFLPDRERIWGVGATVDRWFARSPHIGVYERDAGQHDSVGSVDRVTGCAMFVRREVYERVGYLDDRFFIYHEEYDWCLRARAAGWDLRVVPKSVIYHYGHRDSGRRGRPFMTYLLTRNHLLLLRKHGDYFRWQGMPALAYFAGAVARTAAASAAKWIGRGDATWRADAAAALRGVLDGVLGHWGPPPV